MRIAQLPVAAVRNYSMHPGRQCFNRLRVQANLRIALSGRMPLVLFMSGLLLLLLARPLACRAVQLSRPVLVGGATYRPQRL